MTALCGGGTSSPLPGAPAVAAFAGVAVDVLLDAAGLGWLIPFILYFQLPVLDVPTLCATDPPPLPTFTADDALVLVRPWDPSHSITGTAQKIHDLIAHLAWYQFCRCDVGTATALPHPATNTPTGIPTVVDGTGQLVVVMQQATCKMFDLGSLSAPAAPPVNWDQLSFDDSGWVTPVVAAHPIPNQNPNYLGPFGLSPRCVDPSSIATNPLAPWATPPFNNSTWLVRWKFELPQFDPSVLCVRWVWWDGDAGANGWFSGPCNINGAGQFPFNGGANWHGQVSNLRVGSNLIAFQVNGGAAAGFDYWHGEAGVNAILSIAGSFGTPGGQGCCPTDPSVLQLLTSILQTVTLIQRQDAPFGYVVGATHTLLSGQGEISVQGLIGALVTVTATSSATGSQSGHPAGLFEAGWINWGNADGFAAKEFISTSPQVSLPAAAGQYTRLGYSLETGCVVTITELVREP